MKKITFFIVLLLAAPAFGFDIKPYRKDLSRIEAYLNGIKDAVGRFKQAASDGSKLEGDYYLSRPGKMRLDYNPPAQFQLIANDGVLIYHDRKLGQVSYLDTDLTPTAFILRKDVSFTDPSLEITDIKKDGGRIEITLRRRQDPMSGSATLVFTEDPVGLRKWQVTDAQNVTTEVTLGIMNRGAKIDPAMFEFVDPKKQKRPGDF